MSVLERVKSGLGIKVVELQQQPLLRVQEAPQAFPVRVVEGGGFAPLKVAQAPLQPQIRVTGAKPEPDRPLLQRVLEGIAEFAAPSPKGVRPQDVVREFLPATKEVAGDIGQSIARSFVATSQTLFNALTQQDLTKPFVPRADFEKKLFGDQPVNFESIGREVASIIGKGESVPSAVAIPLGMVFAGLDVVPVGSGAKQGIKQAASKIAKLNKADEIVPILKQVIKGEDSAIASLAKGLEQVTDAKQIEQLLTKAQTTKPIPPDLQPLAQEARKYKSAEEFVNSQRKVLHGTDVDFDIPQIKEGTVAGEAGFFTTTSKTEAGQFGKKIKEFFVAPNIKMKTIDASSFDSLKPTQAERATFLKEGKNAKDRLLTNRIFEARRTGFDAVEIKNADITGKDFARFRDTKQALQKKVGELKAGIKPVENDLFSGKITPEQFEANPLVKQLRQAQQELRPTQTIFFNKDTILTKSQLTDIYNQAVKGAEALPELPKGGIVEKELREIRTATEQENLALLEQELSGTLRGVPKTTEDFERLPFNQQERIFSQLPKSLQDEIMSVTKADIEVPNILKDIRKAGGIKSSQSFEFEEIPINLRNNKTGIAPDELPDALRGLGYNFQSGDEVLQAVVDATGGRGAFVRQAVSSVYTPKPSTFRKAKTALERLTKAITSAKPVREAQEELYSIERARRAARAESIGQKVGGEKGFFAQLGQLKGELPKAKFEQVRSQFAQSEIDSLFDTIQGTESLLPFEKITTKGALAKLFDGSVPTRNEIELLREIFPKNFIDAILKKRPRSEQLFELIGNLINVPRTMMASMDFSAPLRQGLFLIGRPKQFLPSFAKMFKYAFSERAYQGGMDAIKARPTYKLMREHKLALTEIGGMANKAEEAFMGSIIERVPGIGHLVKISNRAYTGFLNQLRADVFDDLVRKVSALKIKQTDEMMGSLASYINAATGRGNLPKTLERAAPFLNATFFSPRLMAARINLLNPYFYATLNPFVRKQALRDLLIFGSTAATVLGLASLNDDVEIGADPRSADFGKIKAGNTRYDMFGGFQQYVRMAAQLVTGEIVSTTTGRTMTVGEGFGMPDRFDIALRFFEHKTAPLPSFLIGLMKGETAIGEDFDVPTEIGNRFVSFVVQDLYDLAQEKGIEHIWEGMPAIFGIGVQTYGRQELVSGESRIGEPTTQIRPVRGLVERVRESVLGPKPLGTSKGFSVEAYVDQLNGLPRNESADVLDEIIKSNPELAKKIINVIDEREKGITPKDKDLKAKGVASGDRALAVKKEMDKLETKEAKADLWDEYVKKGVITKEVARQLVILLK